MNAVILGAGPAGLSAARLLSKNKINVTVIDRLSFVGGASASQPVGNDNARMDFGPHVFHLKNPEVNNFFFSHTGEEKRIKYRNERILVSGKLFRYPLEITEVLRCLTPGHILWMGSAFIVARIRRHTFPAKESNFEEWGVSHFGRPLYEFTCGKYTEKVWGIRPTELSAKLAEQKLKDLRLRDIISKFFGTKGQEHKKYWNEYVYPEKGIGVVFDNMAEFIKKDGGRILLSSALKTVKSNGKRVTSVTVTHSGKEETIHCDILINTIPLTHLASALEKGNSEIRISQAQNLRYRGLILVNVEFNIERITPYDWVYLLDGIFRCNRFTEQKNMGGEMIPKDKTILCFELAASPEDAHWHISDELISKIVLEDISKIDFIDRNKILNFFVTRLEDAYPMYTNNFEKILNEVISILSSTENLMTIGRQGLFLNNDIHDSMEMGMKAADFIINRKEIKEWYKFAENYIEGRMVSGR